MDSDSIVRSMLSLIQAHPIILLFGVSVLYLGFTRYRHGLRQVPGPFVASFSNFWRLYIVWKEDMPWTSIRLHQRYGDLVRIGPNAVSVGSPEGLKIVYGPDGRYNKVLSPTAIAIVRLIIPKDWVLSNCAGTLRRHDPG